MPLFDPYRIPGAQEKEPTFGSELKNAVPRSLGQGVQGVGQIAEDIGWEDNPIKRYGQSVIDRNPTQINSLQDIADHPTAALGSGVGNAIGFLLPSGAIGLGAKAYGLGRMGVGALQTINAAVPSYGGIREEQIKDGNNAPIDILSAGVGAVTSGWIEQRFGLNKMLGLSDAPKTTAREFAASMAKTPLRTGAKEWGKTALAEGAEELAQNPIEQIAAYQDPTSDKSVQDTLFSGAMGALGGLGLGGYGGVRHALQHHQAVDLLNSGALHDKSVPPPMRDLASQYRAGQIDTAEGTAAGDQWLENYRQYLALENEAPGMSSYLTPSEVTEQVMSAATNEGAGLPVQKLVDNVVGVHQPVKADASKSAFNMPSGVYTNDENGIERELTQGELAAIQAGDDITQKPVKPAKEEKPRKLSKSAARFEKIIRDDVGSGAVAADNPLVVAWDSSNKTASDAVAIGKKYAEAMLAKGSNAEGQEAEPESARSVLEGLIAKIKGAQQRFAVGMYFGYLNGQETDTATIAERRGVSRQASNSTLKAGLSNLAKIAEQEGVSLDELKALIEDDKDTGITVSQNEILQDTQTSELDQADLGTALSVHDNTKTSGEPVRRYIDPEQAFQDTLRRTNGDANQASLARARAVANNTELAKADAEEGPLEERVVGSTIAPKYNHSPEEIAKAKSLWEEMQEEQGLLPWESLTQDAKDSYTQKAKDVLGHNTAIPNYASLDSHAKYLSEDVQNETNRSNNTVVAPGGETKTNKGDDTGVRKGTQSGQETRNEAPAETQDGRGVPERNDTEVTAESIVSEWNKAAKALGVVPWEGLSDEQKNYILGSGTWEEFNEAAQDVLKEINGDTKFSEDAPRKPVVNNKLLSWAKEVLAGRALDRFRTIVTAPSAALKEAGFYRPFVLDIEHARHTMNIHREITPEHIASLPDVMQRPRAVVKNGNSFVITVDLRVGGKPIVVAVRQENLKDGSKVFKVTNIATAFPQNNSAASLARALLSGDAVYAPEKEVARLRQLLELQPTGSIPVNPVGTETASQKSNKGVQDLQTSTSNQNSEREVSIKTENGEVKFSIPVDAPMRLNGKNFSEGETSAPSSVGAITKALKDAFFTPARFDSLVTVFATQDEAVKAIGGEVAQASEKGSKIKGFTSGGKVYLIAENIPAGKELGVFLHEVGVHLGMEKLIGKANMQWLASKVEEWANKDDGSVESRIAKEAVARAAKSSSTNKQEELIAYMVEGLVNAGITPQAHGVSQGHQWFRKLWAAAKSALRRLGFKNPNFSGQHLIDLAYGAADLEVSGVRREIVEAMNEPVQKVLVNGIERPMVDSTGKQIHATLEGVKNFWEWFDGNAEMEAASDPGEDGEGTAKGSDIRVDSQGRPRIFYHGTDTAISAFDPSHKGKHDKGWLGKAAVYVATDSLLADSYANIKANGWVGDQSAPNGQNVMPLYMRAKRLLELSPRDKQRIKSFSEVRRVEWTRHQIAAGYDGSFVNWGNGGLEIAVFSPNDVKAAYGNTGGFSRSTSEISFSESIPEKYFSTLSDAVTNVKGFLKEAGLGWYSLDLLADRMKSKAVETYRDVMVGMQQTSKDIVYRASMIDQDWSKISPAEQTRLSEVMRTATRISYDPENTEPADERQRELKQKWNALSKGTQELYARVRDFYSGLMAERKAIMLDAANNAKLAGKNVSEVERMFAETKGPYFPLMRLGRWYAVGMSDQVAELMAKEEDGSITGKEAKRLEVLKKDPEQYRTTSHNSKAAAVKASKDYQARYGNGRFNVAEEKINNAMRSLPGLPEVESYLSKDMPTEVRDHVKQMMTQMIFDLAPEHSALKNMMKRQGIYGEEEDMRRVFAQSALSQAHYISRLKHSTALSKAMVDVRAEARARSDNTLLNELTKRNMLAMTPDANPMVDRVLQTSYFAHLGVSPAFILTNMTQVPMITAPWLGARHGYGTSSRAIAAAFSDVAKMVKTTYSNGDLLSELNWKDTLSTEEADMFQKLMDRNLIDITIEHDLGSVAEMKNTKIDRYIKYANAPVRITETANRAITALAAYRLAKAEGKSEEFATNHAAKAVADTQLDYSALNTPRHMRSVFGSKALAKLMFQFRKYQVGMLSLLTKNMWDAVKGQDEETRTIARRTIAGLFGTTGLMAGALGLPFFGAASWVLGMMGNAAGSPDDPYDFEVEFRNWLADVFGKDVALIIAKGIPSLFGMDLSKRVGMSDIAAPLPFLRHGKTGTETVANTLFSAMGAPFGTMADMLDGIQLMGTGQVAKGAEKVIPIKAAQNVVRAWRYWHEGLTTRKGEVVLPDEKFSAWDLALRGAGFQPTIESEYYAANQVVAEKKAAASDVRNNLLRDYAKAKIEGDDTSDIDAKINDFNQRHTEKGVRVDASSKIKAVQARRRMAAERNDVGVQASKANRPFMDSARFAS